MPPDCSWPCRRSNPPETTMKMAGTNYIAGFLFSPNMLPKCRGSYLALRIAFSHPVPWPLLAAFCFAGFCCAASYFAASCFVAFCFAAFSFVAFCLLPFLLPLLCCLLLPLLCCLHFAAFTLLPFAVLPFAALPLLCCRSSASFCCAAFCCPPKLFPRFSSVPSGKSPCPAGAA